VKTKGKGGRWTPALWDALREYDREKLTGDVTAGVTVGLVALPLAMAFGIASGVTPQAGIYTAIIGGAVVSALGGSRLQVAGPTGAFVVIVADILHKHGLAGLLMATMMSGAMLMLLAVTGLGTAVRFIPRPVVIGFTNGIAVLIVSTQIKDFLGLPMAEQPSEFFARLRAIWESVGGLSWEASGLAAASLAMILLTPKVTKRVPGAIAAMIAGTMATALWQLPVETIGTKFGGIPLGLPAFAVPEFRPDLILPLLPSAFTVAILAAIESLLSAVVADGMSGDRHKPSVELMAQGLANALSPLAGGIPVTGAIARTATNYRAGARTPVAGIIHAAVLLGVILAMAPLARHIPLATLAAVLLVVAYNMGEWKEIPGILRLDWAERSVWLITLALTVTADLTVAVEVGLGLAALLYIKRISQTTTVETVTPEYVERGKAHALQHKAIPPYVSILRIHGPFLFGATEQLAEETAELDEFAPIVILRLRNMTAIDATGLHALEQLSDRLRASGRELLLCGARHQPAHFLKRAEFVEHVGRENILPHVDRALARAREIHDARQGKAGETVCMG
jgi:sulfate permease, SulP family